MGKPDYMTHPRIYNLFPRLVGDLRRWLPHAQRARDMGFNWLYINPIHFCGFSGSCYAIKDLNRVDPLLLPEDHPDAGFDDVMRGDGGAALLKQVLHDIHGVGLHTMVDLVLNHTARDSPLVEQHADWFVRNERGEIQSPSAIDPADARRITVWGDLAELNFAGSPDRAALLDFWIDRVVGYVDQGFEGFRCDAAYKVPVDAWKAIIGAARGRNPRTYFLAETLGARLEEVDALQGAGFDAVFNSLKYWQFDQPWLLEQQSRSAAMVRSIAFPESHDTQRLWTESSGRLSVQKQRYAVAAAFSSGVLMPIGFEFGFERPLHVVETRPQHWEDTNVDLTGFIRRVNEVCASTAAFQSEHVEAWSGLDQPTLLLARHHAGEVGFLAINKDWHAEQSMWIPEAARGRTVVRICHEPVGDPVLSDRSDDRDHEDRELAGEWLRLQPSEVAYLL